MDDLAAQRTLSRRLTIALLTPAALLLVLGLVLGRQILRMADDADWVAHSQRVISESNETLSRILDQETGLRGWMITGDRAFLEPYERASPAHDFTTLLTIVEDNPAQQGRVNVTRERYTAWHALASKAIESGDRALAMTPDQMRDRKAQMDQVRASMRDVLDVETRLLEERMAASEASTRTTEVLFIALLALCAVVIGFVSRRQLGAIASTFGAALAAETQARRAAEREQWIRAGHARLAEALQGEQSVEQLGERVLTELAEATVAPVAAFFTRDGDRWTRRAAHGLDAGTASFGHGEGVVGTVARDGKRLDLRDVPGDYLKLRGGTGEVGPVQVIAFPACVDGTTQAVIELGYLQRVDPRARELLERVGELIATAVRSADHRRRLNALLEETQRQAEELQTQQEELRVQNEELEQQSRVVEQSRAQLANQHAELEQVNAHLEEQTQALEIQRDALARAQADAERANSYKSEFLANMSHELRTPLNSSLILAKLLADNRHGNLDAEQVKFAQTIYAAGNDLLTLINDILDLSKIEAGMLDVRPEPIPLARLTDELSATFLPLARDKQLSLTVELAADLPDAIVSDPTRLLQILRNLLGNAIKFTDAGGVTLRVSRAPDAGLAFDVKDTGIGIPVDQHERIFEAFHQAEGGASRKHGGTGLGLSISRDLARLLGGELSVDSAPGAGSTFRLTLPEQLAARAPVAPSVSTRPTARPIRSTTLSGPAGEPAPAARGGRALLVIEDDVAFAKVLAGLAEELQFEPVVAHTAAAGLARVAEVRPAAILLDVGLPDRSGLTVLDTLKHDPASRHIPVYMLSVEDHVQTALAMGATGYAIKPVKRDELVTALQRLETKLSQRVRRVLVVEDDDRQRDATCKLLGTDAVEIVAVGTAADALTQLKASTFDCMVLDLSLPDRSGFELLEEMSAHERYGFPPVIVYTGRSLTRDEEQRLRGLSSSIIIKGARSPERLLDEVTLFLHQVEADLPPDRQRMLRDARHREAVFEGRRILVVEDDVRNIFALSSVLEPKGAKVEIARNGKEALAHLAGKPGVDLVLMDIMMPEMDGLQATREIRKQPALQRLPIIALTAKAMADDRDACIAAGANDYIAKPLDVDKLLSLARVWMPK